MLFCYYNLLEYKTFCIIFNVYMTQLSNSYGVADKGIIKGGEGSSLQYILQFR
jgi:hypothetical protein